MSIFTRIKNYFEVRRRARQLCDPIPGVRTNAAWALRRAAAKGQDITPAVPALANVLKDEDVDVRKHAARALTYHYLNKRNFAEIEKLLGNMDANVKLSAAEALGDAAAKGQDITLALPALTNALGDKNEDVKDTAAWALTFHYLDKGNFAEIEKLLGNKDANVKAGAAGALWRAAKNGQDITPAVPALANALGDENKNVRKNAAGALGEAADNGEDITLAVPALANVLKDEDADVRKYAAEAFEQAAEKGQDITPAVPALANALGDENKNVRKNAAGALRKAAWKERDITPAVPALANALEDENEDVRENAAWALENFALKRNTIESLNEVQQVIEESFRSWSQPPTNNGEKMAEEIRIKMMIAQLVEKIAQKKAELSKNMAGEMLDAGIKRPKGGPGGKNGVYQAMRKREVF